MRINNKFILECLYEFLYSQLHNKVNLLLLVAWNFLNYVVAGDEQQQRIAVRLRRGSALVRGFLRPSQGSGLHTRFVS